MKKILMLIIFIPIFTLSFSLSADEIFEKMCNRENQTLRGLGEVKFVDPSGKLTGSRLAETWIYVDSNNLKKKLLVLHKPDNFKGTRFLTVQNKGRDDDSWIYLPDLQTSRRLSTSDKSKAFLNAPDGTLTNEDMEVKSPGDYNCKLLSEESVENEPCYIVEATKKVQGDTQYSKQVFWISKTKWLQLKIEYYDKKGNKQKITTYKKIRQVNSVWTTEFFEMKNLKNEWSILYRINKIAYGDAAKVEPERFTNRFLTTGEIK